MREVLFKGKDIKGNWHIGLLAHVGDAWYISNGAGVSTAFEVSSETVGQFTGLTDKNGSEIFEGDIIALEYTGINKGVSGRGVVGFKNGRFGIVWGRDFVSLDGFHNTTFEVIGNIHDNPELL